MRLNLQNLKRTIAGIIGFVLLLRLLGTVSFGPIDEFIASIEFGPIFFLGEFGLIAEVFPDYQHAKVIFTIILLFVFLAAYFLSHTLVGKVSKVFYTRFLTTVSYLALFIFVLFVFALLFNFFSFKIQTPVSYLILLTICTGIFFNFGSFIKKYLEKKQLGRSAKVKE